MKRSLFVRTVPKPTREEILDLSAQGLTTLEISTRYQISQSWARRVKQEFREKGKTCNAKTRNRQPKWAEYTEQIKKLVAEQPDMTLTELKQALGTDLDESTLCRARKRLRLTLKKKS